MPTDPYVPRRLEDRPRQEPNLAPGVKMPPAKSWRADRPGDLPAGGQPHGELLGSPGPNVGYALTLANRHGDRLALAPHEHLGDAVAVVADVAMRRAAAFGRAPVVADVDVAVRILGYDGKASADFSAWRARATQGAAHHYQERRELVDRVPVDVLRLIPNRVDDYLDEARTQLQAAAHA